MATTGKTLPTARANSHDCPFADIPAKDAGVPHIEGRFSALETQVSSLTRGLDDIQRTNADNFREVFAKIDQSNSETGRRIEAISTTRAGNTIPWLMVGIAIITLAATVVYQAINGIAAGVTKAEANLALATEREMKYREDKGHNEERAIQLGTAVETFRQQFTQQHKELDDKLQHETTLTGGIIDAKVAGIDAKLQGEIAALKELVMQRIDMSLQDKQK